MSLVNRTASPGDYSGVRSFGLNEDGLKALQASDIVIAQNNAQGKMIRADLRVTCPLVLWTQHAIDQPAIQNLQDTQERDVWNGFAFVSRWQQDHYARQFGVRPEIARVFHNGIAPAFANQDAAAPWFAHSAAPVLAYTSTPFRGLDVLLDTFPAIRASVPDATLRVYSGMGVYGAHDADHRALFDRCRQTAGVEYIGPIPQTQLARDLAGMAALTYPCIYPETFCVAAAEAMSTGALLLTTKLGALPELYGDFAIMAEPGPDRQTLVKAYSVQVIAALEEARRDPAGAAARRTRQIDFIKANYTWPGIAQRWAAWLEDMLR